MQEIAVNNTRIIHRIIQFVEFKHVSLNQLSQVIGVSNSYFSKMTKNEGSIGEDVVRNILLYYEDLNADWLLTGRGNMLVSDKIQEPAHADAESTQGLISALVSANKALASANETILLQQEYIVSACKSPPPSRLVPPIYKNAPEAEDEP